jgi:hypothetical protein
MAKTQIKEHTTTGVFSSTKVEQLQLLNKI